MTKTELCLRCGCPTPADEHGRCVVCYWKDACRAVQDQRDRLIAEVAELKQKLALKLDG